MNKIMLLCMCIVFVCGICKGEIAQEAQKFTITYSIKYNSLNLAEAHAKEMKIRKQHSDADEVDIKVLDGIEILLDEMLIVPDDTLKWEDIPGEFNLS